MSTVQVLKPEILERSEIKMLIGGEWQHAEGGKTFESRNPSTGEIIARHAEASANDVDRAVLAARNAFEGPWSKFTPMERQKVMLRFADILERNYRELLTIDSHDMGSPIGLARPGAQPADQIRYFAGWSTKIHGETLSNSSPGKLFSYTLREPVGVVGSIIPWNNPVGNTIQKMVPVLATGCTMVLKPSELACLSPVRIVELMEELDLPPGVINVVTGRGETGAAIAAHPDVDKIAFTGSTATGQAIMRSGAINLKRLSLELGGKSPNIVFADADLDLAARGASKGVFGNTGQMCVAGSRIYVEQSVQDELVERMTAVARSLKVGNSLDPATQLGPLVSEGQLSKVQAFIDSAIEQKVRVSTGGKRVTENGLADGYFVEPTVFTNVRDDMDIATDEIFGPVASVMPFTDFDEVLKRANNTRFGLAGGIWSRDVGRVMKASKALRAGNVWVNTYLNLDPNVPFGGYKMSGLGRELGREGLEEYLETKSVWMNMD